MRNDSMGAALPAARLRHACAHFRDPVADEHDVAVPGRGPDHDEPAAVRVDVVVRWSETGKRRAVIPFEEHARLRHRQLRRSRGCPPFGERSSHEAIAGSVEESAAVRRPHRLRAATGGYFPRFAPTGERSNIHLYLTGLVGDVREPATVRRNAWHGLAEGSLEEPRWRAHGGRSAIACEEPQVVRPPRPRARAQHGEWPAA